MGKRQLLQSTFRDDGRSCQEIITDAQRMFDIREKKQEGERIVKEAEEMRKKGLALIKEADSEEKKEKTIVGAIQEFIASNSDFIAENGERSDVIRLREGERSGSNYIVIRGANSTKEFPVFFRI
jgi:hypothetical protein